MFSITSNSAEVSWSPVADTYHYEVKYLPAGYDEWKTSYTSKNSYTLYDLYPEHDYTIKVRACPPTDEESTASSDFAKKDFKTLIEVIPDGELDRVKNVKASINEAKTTVNISWDAVAEASFYDIVLEYIEEYSWQPDEIYTITKTVSASQTSIVDTNVGLGKKLHIKVAARNFEFSNECRWSKDLYFSLK